MLITHGWPAATRPNAVTIGNFDGVHLGHQAMLARLTARAASVAPTKTQTPATGRWLSGTMRSSAPDALRTWYWSSSAAATRPVGISSCRP